MVFVHLLVTEMRWQSCVKTEDDDSRLEKMERTRTGVGGGDGGGAAEVAGGALGLVVLVVAVGRPGAVRGDVVGVVARPVLMDGVAVRPRAAGVVDGLLQRGLRRILPAHAPFCTTTW